MIKQAPAHSVMTDRQQRNNAGCTATMSAEGMHRALGVCRIIEN
jgi:ribosomal protein S14